MSVANEESEELKTFEELVKILCCNESLVLQKIQQFQKTFICLGDQ